MISHKKPDPHQLEVSFFHDGVRYVVTLRSELTDAGAQALVFRALDLMKNVGVIMREVIGEEPLHPEAMKDIDIVVQEIGERKEKKTKKLSKQNAKFEGVWEAIKKEL